MHEPEHEQPLAAASASTRHVNLDPENWEEFRALGHVVFDEMVDYIKGVRDRPAWQSPDRASREALDTPLPRDGRPIGEVYEQFRRHVLPYPTGNIHPRFWGWVMGSGTPVGMIADLAASAMNCHVSGYDQAATLVERQVVRWLAEMLDYPRDASGLLVSGGTVANLIGLTVARNVVTDQRVRTEGMADAGAAGLTVYGSSATHGWAERSCDLLGLGERAFRKVPIDSRHRVRVEEMARMIEQDLRSGQRPFAIVGNAGTVTCGATDDLVALADLAAAEGLWFHIDGAFGALAKLSPRHRHVCEGLERADSVAFDLHKWGCVQYEVGAVLVRDRAAHRASFSFGPSYLESSRGGIAVEPTEFASLGVQLSRGFRALKVWMHLSALGVERIGRVVGQNIDDVQYLKAKVLAEPALEVLGPAEMNVLCFRYRFGSSPEGEWDALNAELLVRVQESGVAVPSNARVDGRFALRVANTNHRTTPADFDLLVDAVLKIGRQIERERAGSIVA